MDFLIPFASSSVSIIAWIVWGLILFAELLAIGMRWDIQRRLKTLDKAIA